MKKFLVLATMLLLFNISNAQTIISNYNTSSKIFKIEGGILSDYNTSKKMYKFESGIVSDYNTSKKMYKIEGGYSQGELFMIMLNLGLI